jgi:hypothetical protein
MYTSLFICLSHTNTVFKVGLVNEYGDLFICLSHERRSLPGPWPYTNPWYFQVHGPLTGPYSDVHWVNNRLYTHVHRLSLGLSHMTVDILAFYTYSYMHRFYIMLYSHINTDHSLCLITCAQASSEALFTQTVLFKASHLFPYIKVSYLSFFTVTQVWHLT